MNRLGRAKALLLELEGVVDLVAHRMGDRVHVASATAGRVTLGLDGRVLAVSGEDPLADLDRYPNAHDSITQIFTSAFEAPDLVISHDPAHKKYDIGDHGSLRDVHSCAPIIAAGPGIASSGRVPDRLRMVDVAPTIGELLGVEMLGIDGRPHRPLLTGARAGRVFVFLLDGTNPDMLRRCIDNGRVPTIAGIEERGTSTEVIASFPTVTLANHTTIMTGCHPGRSGVPANEWHDRYGGAMVNLLDLEQMMTAGEHLAIGIETIHHAIHRGRSNAFTASTFEYCDAGADWSSFGEIRDGRRTGLPVRHRDNEHINPAHVNIDWYRRQSQIDASSAHDAIALFEQGRQPDFLFVNFSLTDETGHHAGPFSDTMADALAETDARVADVLAAAEAAGALEDAAVFVLADHSMAECDPGNDLVISDHLAANGIEAIVTEETFVYL